MARTSYQEQLTRLRGEVGAMADLVVDRYEAAVEVLHTGDPQQAERVISGDDELNEWYLDIESDCIDLLALQQPVASDLRFITSSFKIVTDLERIGDLATNLAAYGRESGGSLSETVTFDPIAAQAGEMVADAMRAYTTDDAAMAREVAARDDDLDEQCRAASEAVIRTLLRTSAGGEQLNPDEHLEQASRALLTIRDIERVGDHAVNVCARTVYMIDNDEELIY
jgi:phosphate transport system protein